MSTHPLKEHLQKLAPSLSQEKVSDKFDSVILDDEEVKEVLRQAREDKYYRLKKAAYFEELSKEPIRRKYTGVELMDNFKKVFSVDADNEKIIKILCAYFSGDPNFERDGFKLTRGILLFGGVGVGKTTLLRSFSQNQIASYRIVPCRQIESEFAEDGDKVVNKFSYNYPIAHNSNPFGHQEIGYCFDDLGTEASVSRHFGKAKNIMAEILLNRYDQQLDFRYTHITTNLSVDEIEQTYGTRVLDRIKQAFNIICFDENAKSRR